jgi:hypothetical protein
VLVEGKQRGGREREAKYLLHPSLLLLLLLLLLLWLLLNRAVPLSWL